MNKIDYLVYIRYSVAGSSGVNKQQRRKIIVSVMEDEQIIAEKKNPSFIEKVKKELKHLHSIKTSNGPQVNIIAIISIKKK